MKSIVKTVVACVVSSLVAIGATTAALHDNGHSHFGSALHADCTVCVSGLREFISAVKTVEAPREQD